MNIHPIMGQIAGVLMLIQVVPYIATTLQGKTKPQRTTYAIWTLVNVISAASYIAAGAISTKWVSIVWALTSGFVFLLSFKYGMGGKNKLDITCLTLAILAIALWVSTNNPLLALYTSVVAVLLGYIPTVKKAYLMPQTENHISWSLVGVAAVLNALAIDKWTIHIVLLPLLYGSFDLVILGLLLKSRERS